MSVVLGNLSDKTLGWCVLGSLVLCWAVLGPVVLAVDSRIVFGLFAALFTAWLFVVAVRMLQTGRRVVGWGIIGSFGLFLALSVVTTRGIPLVYLTLICTGWAGYTLLRSPQVQRADNPDTPAPNGR